MRIRREFRVMSRVVQAMPKAKTSEMKTGGPQSGRPSIGIRSDLSNPSSMTAGNPDARRSMARVAEMAPRRMAALRILIVFVLRAVGGHDPLAQHAVRRLDRLGGNFEIGLTAVAMDQAQPELIILEKPLTQVAS